MKRIARILIVLYVLFLVPVCFAYFKDIISLAEVVSLHGLCLTIISAVLVFSQLRVNLNFNQRKAATDFIFGPVQTILLPLEVKLKALLNKDLLLFGPADESFLKMTESKNIEEAKKNEMKEVVISILNFYERMSIVILKEGFDEDICYDDKGLLMINFHEWVKSYIVYLENNVEIRAYANSRKIVSSWKRRYEEHVRSISDVNAKSLDSKIIVNGRI